MSRKRPSMNKRAALLFVIFSVLFFTLTYRFFVIQLTGEAEDKVLAAYAEEKYSKERTLEANRGSILDRNGSDLAVDTVSYKLVAILSPTVTPEGAEVPNHVVDPSMTANKLAPYLEMEESKIYERLSLEGFQVEFGEAGRNLSHDTKTKIEELKLPGITFVREKKRAYPNGVFASHLIGFANYQKASEESEEEMLVGQMGIEALLNKQLAGHNGNIQYQSDLWGFILPDAEQKVEAAKDGNTVYLTIDKKIQTFLEDAMNEVQEEYKPTNMMALVADAKTGEILAMAQRPTFNPNTREGLNDTWQNIVVETAIEPGSTMKIFTLAAAIEEGVFNPNAEFKSGSYPAPGRPIYDYNYSGWGNISYLEGFQRSSNVAIAYLLEAIGTDKFREYLDAFKFGIPTGIGLPNEASGIIQYQWPRDKITTAFGQATSVTALQLIQAMTAITNGGKMMEPSVIDKIVDPNGKVVEDLSPELVGNPISKDTANEVMQILETVVSSENGSGKRFAIEGYHVGGKTGTAQIYDVNIGDYLEGSTDYIYSFIGAAPVEDPELIVYVAVQQPDLNVEEYEAGSVPVSKIFNPVMKSSLQYLNIEPDQTATEVKTNVLPDVTGKTIDQAKQEIESVGLEPIIIGNGKKINTTTPEIGAQLLASERVLLFTDGTLHMPDMSGWSFQDVMKLANGTGIPFTFDGSGYVSTQSIAKGTQLTKDTSLHVEFRSALEIYQNQLNEQKKTEEETAQEETEQNNSE